MNYNVRLIPISSLRFGDRTTIEQDQVVFEVTPTFSESRTATYTAVTPVHIPGSMQVYRNTESRTFTVGATLISRTAADAVQNRRYLQTLRGWLLPYFGATDTLSDMERQSRLDNAEMQQWMREDAARGTALSKEDQSWLNAARIAGGVQLTGAPPDVLYLYAYSTSSDDLSGERFGRTSNINRVPVVLSSLNISYPDDVDYIPVGDPDDPTNFNLIEPFPMKMSVELTLLETHSPREFERFDLAAFKAGTLANF